MSVKLDHSHRTTAQKIFGHPLNHNIKWHDVLVLLARFGVVHETHSGNWAVTVDEVVTSFGSTRPKDLTDDQVIKVRHFLQAHGINLEVLNAA